MYELYPYFTNDSTVGLFSRQDDDIYHSTYGALSESWQKFIIPSGLAKYIQEHESVKILDICYGIGYNTKTSLNVFINNFLEQEKISKNKKNNFKKHSEFAPSPTPDIAAIDTDNIHRGDNDQFYDTKLDEVGVETPTYFAAIDTDNTSRGFERDSHENHEENYCHPICCNNILIDAVDLDKTLIYLSPFIADASKFNFLFKKNYEISVLNEFKYNQIKNIKNFKRYLKKEFRLKKEVPIILFEKLIESNPEFFNDVILQTILNYKKYSPFLSRFMVNFAKFYQNQTSNNKQNPNKSTFLHNI